MTNKTIFIIIVAALISSASKNLAFPISYNGCVFHSSWSHPIILWRVNESTVPENRLENTLIATREALNQWQNDKIFFQMADQNVNDHNIEFHFGMKDECYRIANNRVSYSNELFLQYACLRRSGQGKINIHFNAFKDYYFQEHGTGKNRKKSNFHIAAIQAIGHALGILDENCLGRDLTWSTDDLFN